MNTLAALKALDKLFSSEHRWTQGDYAKNADGRSCSVYSGEACRWCLVGAIDNVAGVDVSLRYDVITALRANDGVSLISFNDHHSTTFADVKARIAQAIGDQNVDQA